MTRRSRFSIDDLPASLPQPVHKTYRIEDLALTDIDCKHFTVPELNKRFFAHDNVFLRLWPESWAQPMDLTRKDSQARHAIGKASSAYLRRQFENRYIRSTVEQSEFVPAPDRRSGLLTVSGQVMFYEQALRAVGS